MSNLLPLLALQKLDLQCDALKARRTGMPERAARAACDTTLAELAGARALIQARADELAKAVRALDAEVSDIRSKAQGSEVRLYSGSVTASKELTNLTEEIRLLKERQSGLEDRELELLEAVDEAEAELATSAAERAAIEAEARELDAAIAAAEVEIDAELGKHEQARSEPAGAVPADVLDAYDKLRASAKLGGRAVATLDKRSCSGCRMEMPVMDASRIHDMPWDAIVTCVHCRRMLVRLAR